MGTQKIGNIISDDAVTLPMDELFGHNRADGIIPRDVPSLVIGLDKARETISGFDINRKHYDGDIHWTFSRKERRWVFDEDIKWFAQHCADVFSQNIRYEFIDLLSDGISRERIKDFISWCGGFDRVHTALSRNKGFLFLCNDTSTVYGISVSSLMYAFPSWTCDDTERFIKAINKDGINVSIEDVSNEFGVPDHALLPLQVIMKDAAKTEK